MGDSTYGFFWCHRMSQTLDNESYVEQSQTKLLKRYRIQHYDYAKICKKKFKLSLSIIRV